MPFAAGCARPLLRDARVAGDIHGDSGLDGPVLPDPDPALRRSTRGTPST